MTPSNTARSGLRVFCFTALSQSHAGRGRLWDRNSPNSCWRSARAAMGTRAVWHFYRGANWLFVVPVAVFAVNASSGFHSLWWCSQRDRSRFRAYLSLWGFLFGWLVVFLLVCLFWFRFLFVFCCLPHGRCRSLANYWDLFPEGNGD